MARRRNKSMRSIRKSALIALLLTMPCAALYSQENERILPFVVSVTANNSPTRDFSVTLYRDNVVVAELAPSENTAFELGLDVNTRFSIRVSKVGFRDKVILVDTELPDGKLELEEVAYTLDLEPADRYAHSDPFYLDFPSGIVRWDERSGEFAHSEHYLADIQVKMALLSAQAEVK